MRYRLRTLLIVLAMGPPVLWIVWLTVNPAVGLWQYTLAWLPVFGLAVAYWIWWRIPAPAQNRSPPPNP